MDDAGITIDLQQTDPIPLNVEVCCNPGEMLALIGPSGSGKTTILRAIAGLYNVQQATVICQQKTWQDTSNKIFLLPHQRHVGLVFQNYALFPHMTAQVNVEQALSHLPSSTRKAKAKLLLQKVHLEHLAQRFPKTLSGGQQQRVAVARALAREPQVLLLDEPFSAVDQVTRRRLYQELVELRRSLAIPVILVTHDLDEASVLADRLCVLHQGSILQTGTPKQITERPNSAQVAKLMDQPNLFTAKISGHDAARQMTQLLWHGIKLLCRYQPDYALNEKVCWMINSSNIILADAEKPSNTVSGNSLDGLILECVELKGLFHLLVQIDNKQKTHLAIQVPMPVNLQHQLARDQIIRFKLLQEGIHILPFENLGMEKVT